MSLRTRTLLGLIAIALLTACSGSTGPKTYVIGIANETQTLSPIIDGFKTRMAELGYVEDQNVTYIYRGVLGTETQVSEAEIQSLLDQKADLLLTLGTTPTVAAKQAVANTDMPVVFAPILDPVDAGVVESLSHPGGNLTGIQSVNTTAKVLEWLIRIAPGTKTVYAPYNPADAVAQTFIQPLPDAAAKLGVQLMLDEVGTGEEALAAIRELPADSAILFITSPSLNATLPEAEQLAIELRIPTGARNRDEVGPLVTYTTDSDLQGRQAAELVNKILNGASPADLPVEAPEFRLIINLKFATAIGLDISDDLLRLADSVIR